MAGIHAGDGAELSLAATFPQLAELERDHGSILRTMVATRPKKGATRTGSAFLTPEGGLRDIVDALRAALPDVDIRTGTPVENVSRAGETYRVTLANGNTVSSRAVVLATPAFATSALVRNMAPELATILGEIPFVATAIVTLAYEGNQLARPLDGSGYVSPRAEGGPVVACSWTSSKFRHRAPKGTVLLRLFIGRAGQDAIANESPETLVAIARREVESTIGVRGEPILSRVARWPNALPQYNRGHLERVGRIEFEVAKLTGLELAGASYKGVGIPDCIQSGWEAAERIMGIVGW